MKVIFLAIDGVLNSDVSFCKNREDGIRKGFADLPHKMHVNELNRIIDRVKAEIVLSSSWRIIHSLPSMRIIFHICGVERDILDFTPRLPNKKRANEIQMWLNCWQDSNKAARFLSYGVVTDIKIEDFVILDDDPNMDHLTHKLIQTDFKRGLDRKTADEAIRRLS